MVIFDRITKESFFELESKLEQKNIKCSTISMIKEYNHYDDNVFCIFKITKSFFDVDAFEFLRSQNTFDKLNIILVIDEKEKNLDAKVAIDYIYQLNKCIKKSYKVIAEVKSNEQDYIFEIINSILYPSTEKRDKYQIYTDGACSGNPGAGGWAAIILSENEENEISGGEYETTNNRMELTAPIKALETILKPSIIEVYSDSAYLINAFELNWIDQWKKRNWKNSEGITVKNIDLWQKLVALASMHEIKFIKVKGHADNEYNNRCDKLAVIESKNRLE